jgi:hypothetical protein
VAIVLCTYFIHSPLPKDWDVFHFRAKIILAMDDLVPLSHSVKVFLRILLLNFMISLYGILLYLLFTTDAISTWILRSKIYLAILVLVVVIRRLQRIT